MIQPPVTLNKVHLFASWIAKGVGPDLIVKANRIDNERISLPLSNRVPQPTGSGILRKRSSVRPNSAPNVKLLVENQNPAGNLHDFVWVGKSDKHRRTCRLTAQNRIILRPSYGSRPHYWEVGIESRLPPRCERRTQFVIDGIHAGRSWHIASGILHPDTRQVMREGGSSRGFGGSRLFTGLSECHRRECHYCYQDREQTRGPISHPQAPPKLVPKFQRAALSKSQNLRRLL